jgi:hypothetical protein
MVKNYQLEPEAADRLKSIRMASPHRRIGTGATRSELATTWSSRFAQMSSKSSQAQRPSLDAHRSV